MSRTHDVLNIFSKGKDVVYFKAHSGVSWRQTHKVGEKMTLEMAIFLPGHIAS